MLGSITPAYPSAPVHRIEARIGPLGVFWNVTAYDKDNAVLERFLLPGDMGRQEVVHSLLRLCPHATVTTLEEVN